MKNIFAALLMTVPVALATIHAQAGDEAPVQAPAFDMLTEMRRLKALASDRVVTTIGGVEVRESALKGGEAPAAQTKVESEIQVVLAHDMTESEIRDAADRVHAAYERYRSGMTKTYLGRTRIIIDVLPGDADEIRKQYEKDLGKLLEKYLQARFEDTLQEEIEVSIKGTTSRIANHLGLSRGGAPEAQQSQEVTANSVASGVRGVLDRAGTDVGLRGPVGRIKIVFKVFDLELTDDLRAKLEYEKNKEKSQNRLVLRKDLGTTILVGNVVAYQSVVCDAGVRKWASDKGPFMEGAVNRKEKYANCKFSIEW
jgi:hypothetical protein